MNQESKGISGLIVEVKDEAILVLSDGGTYHSYEISRQIRPFAILERISEDPEHAGRLVSHGIREWSQEEIARTMYRYDSIADDRIPDATRVTDAHIRQFREQGFLVIDRLLEPAEVEAAVAAIMDIIAGKIAGPRLYSNGGIHASLPPDEREGAVRKIHKYVDHAPALRHAAFKSESLAILAGIFGEPAKLLEDQAILKPPSAEAGAEKPWHQDMAYGMLSQTKQVCGIWIALDEAGLDNGCMHVIPRSHMDGPVPHYALRDWQLCDSRVAVDRDVAVTLKPGGALIFSGLLHHGTPPNLSGRRRRALQFHYCPESSRRMTPAEFKMMFSNAMSGAEC